MKTQVLAAALLCSLMAVSPLSAQQPLHWKAINGWEVGMEPATGNGCFIESGYEDGTHLRLGFDFTDKQTLIYLSLGNAKWKSLEAGKDYPLEFQFDDNPAWKATAAAAERDNVKFLVVTTTDSNFAIDFSRKLGMRVTFMGRSIAALKLKSSSEAVREMLDCQDAVRKYASKPAPETPPTPSEPQRRNSASDPFEL
ncbi:hypothetical protein [Oryzifoliimicrobium ureilyticus]|uniref:hypothetical protein n=1 Tax=Oryzifoliimicrobium ureilyticus TaxID=3113724 RepID=UPI00307672B0